FLRSGRSKCSCRRRPPTDPHDRRQSRQLHESALLAPSGLDGWSRLTIACHLRYGAQALSAMTAAALEGRPASYYPDGSGRHRPRTLVPLEGETTAGVVDSLHHHSDELHQLW